MGSRVGSLWPRSSAPPAQRSRSYCSRDANGPSRTNRPRRSQRRLLVAPARRTVATSRASVHSAEECEVPLLDEKRQGGIDERTGNANRENPPHWAPTPCPTRRGHRIGMGERA